MSINHCTFMGHLGQDPEIKYLPDGTLKMVGSTTKLTTKGMSVYFEQLYAYAVSELDVRFSANV
jgi:hypothetical protein